MAAASEFSQMVQEKLQIAALRIGPAVSALLLWERYLTAEDRKRLGGDVESAWRRCRGTAGMWVELRGVTRQRAVLDVAKLLGFLRDEDYAWLLREIGEFADAEEAMLSAIDAGNFVLVESPREAYWNKKKIQIDWNTHAVSWEFLLELGRHGKLNQPVERTTFGDHAHADVVTKRKSRLTANNAFPISLADKIQVAGRSTQQLKLPREQIRIFERTCGDVLREWTP